MPSDVNFHKTGKGMSSPAVERRRSRIPPLPNNLIAPKPRPKSTHAVNAELRSVLQTTKDNKTTENNSEKAANNSNSSKGSPKSKSGHNTLPRIKLRKNKDKDRTPTPPKESSGFFSRSHKRENTPTKDSIGSPKLIKVPKKFEADIPHNATDKEKSSSEHEASKENDSQKEIDSSKTTPKESTPVAMRKAREKYFNHESFREKTPDSSSFSCATSSDTLSDFKNFDVKSLDSHSFDKFSVSSAPMPYKHSRTASIGSTESSFSANLLGYNTGGHRRLVQSFTEDDGADTFSEPGNLGRAGSLRQSHNSRATTPPPKAPPPKGLHKDVYNTVFALQELGNGWSDYLTRVRTLWDGHMDKKESVLEADEKALGPEDPKQAESTSELASTTAPPSDTPATHCGRPEGCGHDSKGMRPMHPIVCLPSSLLTSSFISLTAAVM